jgi:N-acetylmuramoyl-L-alanine amidase
MNYSTRDLNKTVKFIIIHYTGMKSFKEAYKKLSHLKSDVSCHYLISRKGIIFNLLSTNLKAWHAGESEWKNLKSLNDYSIGIELENKGHDHGYTPFTKKQYTSLNKLISALSFRYSLSPVNILGHSDISPNRKKDPGELFEWEKIKSIVIVSSLKKLSLDTMLIKYGFSKKYITNYKTLCILAIKRKLGYRYINSTISKSFIKDFKHLIK